MDIDGTKPSEPRTSMAAVASLVCGILGCIPFVTGLAAVILGIVGIKKTRNPFVTGKGMAISGLVLGVLSLGGWTLGTVSFAVGVYTLYRSAEPARSVGEEFTRNLSEGNVDAALAISAEGMKRETLASAVEPMKPWGTFKDLGLTTVNYQITNGRSRYSIGGTATFSNATRTYTLTLDQMGVQNYKVVTFHFD